MVPDLEQGLGREVHYPGARKRKHRSALFLSLFYKNGFKGKLVGTRLQVWLTS